MAKNKEDIDDGADIVLTAEELLPADKPIASYNPIRAALNALKERHAGVQFDMSTPQGLKDAVAARLDIRRPRFRVEKIRQALKAPAIAYGKRIDAEAAALTEELMALEKPIDAQVLAEQKRLAEEKAERERKEALRRAQIQQSIDDIIAMPKMARGRDSLSIGLVLEDARAVVIDEDTFGPRMHEALSAKTDVVEQLEEWHTLAKKAEDAAEALRKQQEEIDRQRRELEQQRQEQAERDAQAERDRKAQEEAAKPKPAPEPAPEPKQQPKAIDQLADVMPERRQTYSNPLASRPMGNVSDAQPATPKPAASPVSTYRLNPIPVDPAPAPAPVSLDDEAESNIAPAPQEAKRPTDTEILEALCKAFDAHPSVVIDWLYDIDLESL